MRRFQYLAYLWAAPATLIGLSFVLVAGLSGGQTAVVCGVIEAHGGLLMPLFTRRRGRACHWLAITLGHVVLGRDASSLICSREHERVHVRQYERWGIVFFPAYLVASIIAWLRGGDAYRDNCFEREAYGRQAKSTR